MTPVVGIDFDNTLVTYDAVMHRAAVDRGLIDLDVPATKRAVRDAVRLQPDGEIEWQRLQALVYGPLMGSARLIVGADSFVRDCRRRGWLVYVVSHKTEFAGYDTTNTNLRDAARTWMSANGFFDADGLALKAGDVFFEATRADKIARIRALACTHFIDDLEEVFHEASFPVGTERLLLDGRATTADATIRVMADWQAVRDYFFPARG